MWVAWGLGRWGEEGVGLARGRGFSQYVKAGWGWEMPIKYAGVVVGGAGWG